MLYSKKWFKFTATCGRVDDDRIFSLKEVICGCGRHDLIGLTTFLKHTATVQFFQYYKYFWKLHFKSSWRKSDRTCAECITFLLEAKCSKITYTALLLTSCLQSFRIRVWLYVYPASPLATEMKSHNFYARRSSVWFIWKRLIFVRLVPEEEPLHC